MANLLKFDLNGRTALITGAAGLLGAQHASALLEVGAVVYLGDVNEDRARQVADKLNSEFGAGRARGLWLDVTQSAKLEAAREKILTERSSLDVLINNAAIDAKVTSAGAMSLEGSRYENFSRERWERELEVGLTGAFLTSQVMGQAMVNQKRGVILNIASDLSVISPDQRLYRVPGLPENQQPVKPVTYSVIKTALIGLTRYLATYWADSGIRVNALSPGGVFTQQPEDFVSRLSQLIPLGRMASADEYRSAVQFLCSDASSYLTGQNIVMDGGRSVL